MPPKKAKKVTAKKVHTPGSQPKAEDLGYSDTSEESDSDAGYSDEQNDDPALTATPKKKLRSTPGSSKDTGRALAAGFRQPTLEEMFAGGSGAPTAPDPDLPTASGLAGSAHDEADPPVDLDDEDLFDDLDEEEDAPRTKKRTRPAFPKKGNRTARIWKWYRDSLTDPWYVACQAVVDEATGTTCRKRIKRGDASTKGMNGHLKRHPKEYAEWLRLRAIDEKNKALATLDVRDGEKALMQATDEAREILGKKPLARKGPITKTMRDYYATQQSLVPYSSQSKSQKRLDLEIMSFLAQTCLPFSLVDHPAFHRCNDGLFWL